MQARQKLLSSAIFLACGAISIQAHATLAPHAILNFNAGTLTCVPSSYGSSCTVTGGSYFAMDTNGDSAFAPSERTAISQFNGVRINTAQPASGSHTGLPGSVAGEAPNIDAAWNFFGNTGFHQTNTAVTIVSDNGSGTVLLDFTGWSVEWSQNEIPMGGSAAFPADTGQATVICASTCAVGDTYTLTYRSHVPVNSGTAFDNVFYSVRLVGTIGTYNTAPFASGVTVEVLENTTLVVDLAANVTDDFGLNVTAVTIPADNSCGTIANNNDGTVTLPACTAGQYTFTYTVADTDGVASNTATVTVNVSANPAPNTGPDTGTTDGTTPIIIDVAANDTDLGGSLDFTSVVVSSAPAHGGTAVNATTGEITYTADAGFAGVDTFNYTIDDNTAQTSADTLVSVTVNAMNVPASNGTLTAGTVAVAASATDGIVTFGNIAVEDTGDSAEQGIAQSCIGGCFDFVVSDLTSGATAQIVLPLSTAIPAPSASGNALQYRKVISGAWSAFVVDTSGNDVASAAGTVSGADIICPPPGSTDYVSGITTGDRCLRLSIVDGGLNDADGAANGTVVDPGGLAETTQIDTRVSGTDGCSMTGNNSNATDHADWLLLAGFMAMLGWFGIKRRQA